MRMTKILLKKKIRTDFFRMHLGKHVPRKCIICNESGSNYRLDQLATGKIYLSHFNCVRNLDDSQILQYIGGK